MTLNELYRSARTEGAKGETARQLLAQTDWFTVNAEFDPKTGDALPQALSTFLAKVSDANPSGRRQDRLYRIAEHARPAVERLLPALNESPRREHALLPVRAVRELDAGSFIKLSTRPGRNIREKLAGKPYLQAVRRFQSVDLPENRLLKACVFRLAELLELRRDILGEPEDELLPRIRSWLLSDEARAIASWDNLSPNNTLLAHRDYRCVWDSWRRLQSLDDDIARDLSRLDARRDTMMRWMDYGRMYRGGAHLFADMPVLFDYEKFTIRTWSPEPIVQRAARRIGRSTCKRAIEQVACLDLAELRPRFADAASGSQTVTETYLWQQWKNATDTVDITLFNSDAAYLNPDASTITSQDLFFASDTSPDHHADRAARAFAGRLREVFKNNTLIWLVPDILNDFELDIIRRNLNAQFPDAYPLPRSVAAAFERVDFSRIRNDGYSIVVVDTIGGTTCVTKLIARFDAQLRERLPDTYGYYWERCPPVTIALPSEDITHPKDRPDYGIVTVDEKGHWQDASQEHPAPFIESATLRADRAIGQFAFCATLDRSPVVGGLHLHNLQHRAGATPLWRDQIPELSIKVMIDGFYQRFYLVPRGTTVMPIRGTSVAIPVREHFALSAGKPFYQFPLFQGDGQDELGFSARLDSPAFPLKRDTVCKLSLNFEYGADEPYTLIFTPLNASVPPVRATWRRTVEEIATNAPAPEYPDPIRWADLRSVPKPGSSETRNLLEWAVDAIDSVLHERSVGIVRSSWRLDKHGKHYAFATCPESDHVFIHEHAFVPGWDYMAFKVNDSVSFELHEDEGRFSGRMVAGSDYNAVDDTVARVRRSAYFPFIHIWRDGRSVSDHACPQEFATAVCDRLGRLTERLRSDNTPQPVKNEILFLLSCLHRDTTDECVEWITEQVEGGSILDPRAVGFALGAVGEEWQQYVFRSLAANPSAAALHTFAYAIWRERHFVDRYVLSELEGTVDALLQFVTSARRPQAVAVGCELLLGLLRTRISTDPEIRMLLQPHQEITKQFAEQIDRLEERMAESHMTLFSRVQININKPEGVRTPDLLYALRLYLTGDDGANAIHITSVSEDDIG